MTASLDDVPRRELVSAMLGRELEHTLSSGRVRTPIPQDAPALAAEDVRWEPLVTRADCRVRRGEIVGLAGLQGSGRTELMRVMFGADKADSGAVTLEQDSAPGGHSPGDSLRRGIAYLPEDRKADGIIPELSLRENLTLVVLPSLSRWGIVRRGRERAMVDDLIERLGIRAASADMPIRDLSGGNQQKVLLARLLAVTPRFLLLDDPMRGIDVGAKAEIERLIGALAVSGMGVLVATSELQEILSLSDVITVMRDGRTVGTIGHAEASVATVTAAIAQGTGQDDRPTAS
jgi:ribose transport system ATP-binding protein